MKIAIHHRSGGYSAEWIKYCQKSKIQYKLVNCYDSDIISQLEDCDALMWNHHHGYYKDVLFAKQLMYSLELCGKKTFPDHNTCWHFDDKVGQKYLFEAIGAPLVPSYVFYTSKEAIHWIEETTFPKVFKLRGGAGSENVRFVRTANEARSLVKIAFGKGFPQFDRIGHFKDCFNKYCNGKVCIKGLIKGFGRLFIPTEFAKLHGPEKGYVYFQDFIPNNSFDIRIMVIGSKAYGLKRMVRKNDFRASGSGIMTYDPKQFDLNCIKLAFEIKTKMKTQSAAFDFVFQNEKPLITEISYSSSIDHQYPGYWDNELKWHDKLIFEETVIIEELVKSISEMHLN